MTVDQKTQREEGRIINLINQERAESGLSFEEIQPTNVKAWKCVFFCPKEMVKSVHETYLWKNEGNDIRIVYKCLTVEIWNSM